MSSSLPDVEYRGIRIRTDGCIIRSPYYILRISSITRGSKILHELNLLEAERYAEVGGRALVYRRVRKVDRSLTQGIGKSCDFNIDFKWLSFEDGCRFVLVW